MASDGTQGQSENWYTPPQVSSETSNTGEELNLGDWLNQDPNCQYYWFDHTQSGQFEWPDQVPFDVQDASAQTDFWPIPHDLFQQSPEDLITLIHNLFATLNAQAGFFDMQARRIQNIEQYLEQLQGWTMYTTDLIAKMQTLQMRFVDDGFALAGLERQGWSENKEEQDKHCDGGPPEEPSDRLPGA